MFRTTKKILILFLPLVFFTSIPSSGSQSFILIQDFQKSAQLKDVSLYADPECVFRKATPTDELTWAIFKKSFKETIGPIYGPQDSALQKLELASDREGFVMYANGCPVGVIAYKTQLSDELADVGYDNSLEIKSLFVIDPASNSGKGYGSCLLDRITTLAKKTHAESLHVSVSVKVPESLMFFQKKKFVVVKIDANHHETGDVEYTLARKIFSAD